MSAGAPLLSVVGLTVRYGPVMAVQAVDLSLEAGEIVSIVGPNGAGKTSLLSALAGLVRPDSGSVEFSGARLLDLRLEDVVRKGVALVPEGRQIFSTLTVEENLRLGATSRSDARAIAREIAAHFEAFPILGRRRDQPAGLLSGGEQQQLAIARALISRPRLLLLDEPSLGLAPTIVEQVYALIRSIRDRDVTILVAEQNANRAFEISDRTYVMAAGRFRLAGTPAELLRHADFDAAYFGVSMSAA